MPSVPFARLSLFRIISFTLAGGDVFQTIPGTYAFYKKQWVKRKLSPTCFFYAVARYMTIISLVTNGIGLCGLLVIETLLTVDYNALGFYGTHFTPATCQSFYMTPNVTAMLAGMAVQILVFIRTYAISGRSKYVWYGLGSVLLLGFPVQIFGITYHRDDAKDKSFMRTSNLSNFVRRVLTQGLLYFIVVFLVNLWVVLEFIGVFSTGAASTLPLAIVLIALPPAIQHLILSTQHLHPNNDTHFSSSQSGSHNKNRRESAIVFGGGDSEQAIELQSSVSVQSRLDDSGKTSRALRAKASKGTVSDVTFGA
ncbi:hypothetical protein B0H11DRAFT_2208857 [Mycena galericulata]|nr:hypothetical protein B0H11DRAFT_2208857 [Mycena galericulata]